jgi:RNA polymerase sigma-70 factor (ECF subfamily)
VLQTVESQPKDAALVRSAQGGDRAAFGVLYEKYSGMVHGILLAHVEYRYAEDLMQDTFVKALEQLPRLREPGAFGGWLAAIARHIASDHHRGSRPMAEVTETASNDRRPDGAAFAVLDLVKKLPESYRETLILRLVEGMTGPEIAARTGLAPDSVRVNLCRGMKLLRSQLRPGQNDE